LNFACSARSRGLDISNVLVFATDEETKKLAESIGLASYYDERVSQTMQQREVLFLRRCLLMVVSQYMHFRTLAISLSKLLIFMAIVNLLP
jgi:hypothetical protein